MLKTALHCNTWVRSISARNTNRHQYVIGLGSNLGDRPAYIESARSAIEGRLGPVTARAPLYETLPLGAADQSFINSALLCGSMADPEEALTILLAIEAELGRVRKERWGNRIIDLDILLWLSHADVELKTSSYKSTSLEIPHPHLLERDFALVPAAIVAPQWRHPTTGRTLENELVKRRYALKELSRP